MIMNEKERIENLLELGDFSSNYHGEVRLIIRYYINIQGMTIKEEIIEKIKTFLEDKMTGYYEWEWEDKIEYYVKEELRNQTPIANFNSLYVTQEEVDIIRTLKTSNQRKLLFTLLMYARYHSTKLGKDRKWVGDRQENIFKSANLDGLTLAQQDYVVADLIELGLVSYSYKVDNLSLKLECLHNDGDIVTWINSFEDLGKFIEDYIKFTYNGYKKCEVCDKTYKPKAKDYSSKYCNTCKKKIQKEKQRESMRKLRKK